MEVCGIIYNTRSRQYTGKKGMNRTIVHTKRLTKEDVINASYKRQIVLLQNGKKVIT